MTTEDRRQGVLLGLAIGDALGAPVEFMARDSFPLVTEMLGGGPFNLPPGAWTDDTAMALCLDESLGHDPELDLKDLLDRFCRWLEFGENTSTGKAVGVGQNTLRSLGNYRRTGALQASERTNRSDGNGAIMRSGPIPALHWQDPKKSRRLSALQSRATHCSDLSAACCELLSDILCDLISGKPWASVRTRPALQHWPEEVRAMAQGQWIAKHRDSIRSTGYVIDTLEAALWSVEQANTFEDALITAVNLGEDADSVAAVAGQLAGARWGRADIPKRWIEVLVGNVFLDD